VPDHEPPHLTEVRESYDTVAEDYAVLTGQALAKEPLLRAMLTAFAELVLAAGPGRVLDVGCGPGHVTAHLRDAGVDVSGIDLSAGMIAVARREHPHLDFAVGSMTALAAADGSLRGVVSCWSLIHLPKAEVPHALAEFHRVLGPGGLLFVGFHVGDERRRKRSGYGGHPMALDVQLWPVNELARALEVAGFEVTTRVVCEPDEEHPVPQCMLLARKRDD
jgi:ubiquinone/menaquinone biosynthesis C-methylase UbiE